MRRGGDVGNEAHGIRTTRNNVHEDLLRDVIDGLWFANAMRRLGYSYL
jgi:uncharacterized protein YlxW (UPF0749 family)